MSFWSKLFGNKRDDASTRAKPRGEAYSLPTSAVVHAEIGFVQVTFGAAEREYLEGDPGDTLAERWQPQFFQALHRDNPALSATVSISATYKEAYEKVFKRDLTLFAQSHTVTLGASPAEVKPYKVCLLLLLTTVGPDGKPFLFADQGNLTLVPK